MRRLLCTVKKWESLSVLQLRDELARRGLKRAGTRADLLARLETSEAQPEPIPDPAPSQPQLETSQLPSLDLPKPSPEPQLPPEPQLSSEPQLPLKPQSEPVLEPQSKPVLEPQASTPPPSPQMEIQEVVEERLPEVHLDSLPKKYLVQEILKRRPTESISLFTPKRDLLATLQFVLISPHLTPSNITDFRSLFLSLHSSHPLPLPDLLQILKRIVDLGTISQNDLNILVNSDSGVMDQMWRQIYSAVKDLEPAELITVLRTMHMFRYVLRKEWGTSEQEEDEKALKDICARLSSLHSSIPLFSLSSSIQLLRHHTKLPHIQSTLLLLQGALLRQLAVSLPLLESSSPTDLFLLFESLPDAAYRLEQHSIVTLIGLIFDSEYNWSNEQALSGLYTLHRLQAPIPISLSIRLSAFSKDYLRRIPASSLLLLLKTMGQTKCLTIRSCSLISEILSSSNYSDPVGIGFYISALEGLAENKYLSFMLGKPYIFGKVMFNEDRLELWMMLRLCGWVGELLESDKLVTLALRAINKARSAAYSFESLRKPMDSALMALIPTLSTQPLYHYQYLSYQFKDLPTRTALCQQLAAILLQFSPTTALTGLLAYLASPLCQSLKEAVDWVEPDRDNLPNFLLAAYKFPESVPRLFPMLLSLLSTTKHNSLTCYELFLMSRFCQMDINTGIHMSSLPIQKQIRQNLISAITISRESYARPEYLLPTLDILGFPSKIMKFLESSGLSFLHLRSLYSEPLILNLICLCLTLNKTEFALSGVPNLSFPPQSLPKSTANRLILALSLLHKKHQIKVGQLVPTIKACEDALEATTIVEAGNLLNAVAEQLKPETVLKLGEKIKQDRNFTKGKIALVQLGAAAQEGEAITAIHQVLRHVNMLEKAKVLQEVMASMRKFKLWEELNLAALTEVLLLCVDGKLEKEEVAPELLQAFTAKLARSAADPDQPSLHPKTGLLAYSPFAHTAVLEPRQLTTDSRSNLRIPSAELNLNMLPEDRELYRKINAVGNAYGLDKPQETEMMVDLEKNNSETSPYSNEFIEIYASIGGIKNSKKLTPNYHDSNTGWVIDLALPLSQIAILFPSASDLVSPSAGDTPGTMYKAKRQQLKAAGWTVISVKRMQWDSSPKGEKEELVRHIRTKI